MPQGNQISIRFLGGAVRAEDVEKLGLKHLPRLVFAGRSNVGKSSLLNALVGSRIARVSQSPGKTKEMNFFLWKYGGIEWALADLPGYGYAKVPGHLQKEWGKEIPRWLVSDPEIKLVVVLVDGRHGYQPQDLELIGFLKQESLPFLVAFTKMDKWRSANQRKKAEQHLAQLSVHEQIQQYVFVSALSKAGIRPLLIAMQSVIRA